MKAVVILALLSLAACGADGEPTPPEKPATPGVTVGITGSVDMGIKR